MKQWTLFVIIGFAGSAHAGGTAPAWFDRSLAGYVLDYSETLGQAGVYDAKKGYYLVRTIECDGGHIRLTLTKDRRIVNGENYKVPGYKHKAHEGRMTLSNKPLRSLSTGKGIAIGVIPARLLAKLGKPSQIVKTGNRKQYDEYRYIWSDVKKGDGVEWANVYVFKAGKLIEIAFYKDAVPGCGGGRSWEGVN